MFQNTKQVALGVLICLLFSFFNSTINAQTPGKQAIIDLKEGYLIVKLCVPESRIKTLQKAGKSEEATTLKRQSEQINDSLITAFNTTYTFSNYLFLKSTDIAGFNKRDVSVLFDSTGSSPEVFPEKYLFIEFGETDNRKVDGLIVKDRNFNPITDDYFPHFMSVYFGVTSFSDMIEKLQDKFIKYYVYATSS